MSAIYLFIYAATIAFSLAEDANKENKSKIYCDKPDVIEAGDLFFDCFSKNVKHSIDKNNSACDKFPYTIRNYVQVANKSCYNYIRSGPAGERDGLEFYKFVQFSIRNGEFADFVQNNGVECIAAVRDKISACVKEHAITAVEPNNKYRKYDNLWKATSLAIDKKTCQATEKIKACTQKAMRDEGYYKCRYENNNVLFVGSLFDFMLERCMRLLKPNWKESQDPENNVTGNTPTTYTTHVLLGVLIALAILALLYWCVRDCHANRGAWKAVNERMSMFLMNRRSTLVNN